MPPSMFSFICGGMCGLRQPSENDLHDQQMQINKKSSADYGTRGKSEESNSTLLSDVVLPNSQKLENNGGNDVKPTVEEPAVKTSQPDASHMSGAWDKHTRPHVKRILESRFGSSRTDSTGSASKLGRPALPTVCTLRLDRFLCVQLILWHRISIVIIICIHVWQGIL